MTSPDQLDNQIENGVDFFPNDDASGFTPKTDLESLYNKVKEGNPHIVDALLNNEINLVINTTKTQGSIRDSYSIRRTALMINIPYYTTIAGAKVAVNAIENLKNHALTVKSLQALH